MQFSLPKERVTVAGEATTFRVDACGKRGCNCCMSAYQIHGKKEREVNPSKCTCGCVCECGCVCACGGLCVRQFQTLILSFIVLTPSPTFIPPCIAADNETPTADLCLHFYKQIFVKHLIIYNRTYFPRLHIKLACRKKKP